MARGKHRRRTENKKQQHMNEFQTRIDELIKKARTKVICLSKRDAVALLVETERCTVAEAYLAVSAAIVASA